jgi:hypothetical protein
MRIEHITVGAPPRTRYTNNILDKTLEALKDFMVTEGCAELPYPLQRYTVAIEVLKDGVQFNIVADGEIAFMNICCFDTEQSASLASMVGMLCESIQPAKWAEPPEGPWLYTIPVRPGLLNQDERSDIFTNLFYIYYALYLAKRKSDYAIREGRKRKGH